MSGEERKNIGWKGNLGKNEVFDTELPGRYELPSNRCWWCGEDEVQPRYYLFVRCKA